MKMVGVLLLKFVSQHHTAILSYEADFQLSMQFGASHILLIRGNSKAHAKIEIGSNKSFIQFYEYCCLPTTVGLFS